MILYDSLKIFWATVADFYSTSVKEFMEAVIHRKMFFQKGQKFFTKVGF